MTAAAARPHGWPTADAAAPAAAACVVIDTNLALDLLVFDDPGVDALRAALQAQALRWLATEAMRAELARVLAYPLIARRLARARRRADDVLAAYDAAVCTVPAVHVPQCPCCDDPDDQHFIELAVAHRAQLLSKDRAILSLSRRLLAHQVTVASHWAPALAS